jgi:hypothetical protein
MLVKIVRILREQRYMINSLRDGTIYDADVMSHNEDFYIDIPRQESREDQRDILSAYS